MDCLVISPDFELKGRLALNKYLYGGHDWDGGRTRAENYRLFLIEALEGNIRDLVLITLSLAVIDSKGEGSTDPEIPLSNERVIKFLNENFYQHIGLWT